MNGIKIEIELPPAVIDHLKKVITDTINEALNARMSSIQKQSVKHTRAEVCKILKVSLPTLDSYLKQGLLQKQTIGRRVLIPHDSIEKFLNGNRK